MRLAVTLPAVPEGLQDAVAIGLASIATWLLVRVRPLANEASNFVAQLLEYTQDERHAASVYGGLASVIDSLVEKDPDREVHIFGYSFGAVVAVGFLYPPASLHHTAHRPIH